MRLLRNIFTIHKIKSNTMSISQKGSKAAKEIIKSRFINSDNTRFLHLFIGLSLPSEKTILQQLGYLWSFFCIFLKNAFNELSCLGWNHRNERKFCSIDLNRRKPYVDYTIHDCLAIIVLKGSSANQHFICEDPNTPDINALVVFLMLNDLRRCIVKSPTKSQSWL